MTITLIIIAALAAAAFGHYWLNYQPAAQRYWQRLPTRQQYLAAHPAMFELPGQALAGAGLTPAQAAVAARRRASAASA
ncbi:hypothetical protein [Chromobacterium sp. IIBBL 290-4]|uniref:hypothetical protein n=1 Tax=Chromobacterium sp. IIBBL 290-4 TaxID=2953890 RepID=UPI0020B874C3|nr:hypothetical protein [Chromobacterium sp. IIBBL 290-4]UTH74522.1 hypothetical protein NKT35_23845 [Chromobacterium sp. IIBBL 290-4]